MRSEALSVENEGRHLQEGAFGLGGRSGRPKTEPAEFLYMHFKVTARVSENSKREELSCKISKLQEALCKRPTLEGKGGLVAAAAQQQAGPR